MAEKADAVVESFRPGVMDKLGLGWETLKKRNLRLVTYAISGYGQDGPFSGMAGHDINDVGYAGMLKMIKRSVYPSDGEFWQTGLGQVQILMNRS
jgi:crotonobetainyl-CoA:carnitine CoA-transferase CaiB-like acyl-CoA transferase